MEAALLAPDHVHKSQRGDKGVGFGCGLGLGLGFPENLTKSKQNGMKHES